MEKSEEDEDEILYKKALKRLKEAEGEKTIPWEEACKLAGWDSTPPNQILF